MNTIASNQSFIIAAYVVTWLAILGYALRLARMGARTRATFERVIRPGAGEGLGR